MKICRREALAAGLGLAGVSLLASEASAEQEDPNIPEGALVLVAQFKAKAGEEESVKKAFMAMVGPTRKEKGCICYNLHQSKADSSVFAFYEQWASKEALQFHGKTPHMAAMRDAIQGKTVPGGGGVTFYEYLQ